MYATIKSPLAKVMKPITVADNEQNRSAINEQRDAVVLRMLQTASESMNARAILSTVEEGYLGADIRNLFYRDPAQPSSYSYCDQHSMRIKRVSSTMRRLENRGEVISCMYRNRRYYSVPLEEVN